MKNHLTQGSSQKKSGFLLVFLLVLLVGLLQSFTACDLLGTKSGDTILGEWKSQYGEGYIIKYDSALDSYVIERIDPWGYDYKGTIQLPYTTSFSKKEGYIIFQVNEKGSQSSLEVNKYFAVRWEDFLGDTVRMGDAWRSDGILTGTNTPQQAKDEYTVKNGYFTGMAHSIYQRQ